jgi:hypothetical protein
VNQTTVASFLGARVDWNRFFSVVGAIGTSLDGQKDRFDKSDILELAVEVYSNGAVQYKNEEGRDHYIPELDAFVEMKYDAGSLFSPARLMPQKIVTLTLVNTMGDQRERELPENYADFVIAVGANGCGVVSKSTVIRHLVATGDQLKARIPFELFTIIKRPSEIARFAFDMPFAYKTEKVALQRAFLAACVNTSRSGAEHR